MSEKRVGYRSYTARGWKRKVAVVGRMALSVRWAVDCIGLRGKIYEQFH